MDKYALINKGWHIKGETEVITWEQSSWRNWKQDNTMWFLLCWCYGKLQAVQDAAGQDMNLLFPTDIWKKKCS